MAILSHSNSEDYIFLVLNQTNQGNNCPNDSIWIIDSGTTSDMSFPKNLFYDLKEVPPFNVSMGDAFYLKSFGPGSITVSLFLL